ncbi:MAG: hypothetical protein Q8R36_05120 [bacterium]|nr:hypothetical protein [bacterium]
MTKIMRYGILSITAITPFFAFAQGAPGNLQDLIGRFVEILAALIPLLFGIALIGFLWGVAITILQADNEEKRKEGRQIMVWGIIGLFVMTAVWGIVIVIGGTFGIRFLERPNAPQLPGGSGVVDFRNYGTFFQGLEADRAIPNTAPVFNPLLGP